MKLLVTGAWQEAQKYLKAIESMGHEVFFMQNESDGLSAPCEDIEGVICNGLFLYHDIDKFKKLSYIQLTSAGFDRVPMDYVKSHNIKIHNARGVYSIPMAEFALSGVLQLYKQSRYFCDNQKKQEWEKHRGLLELYGKAVGIIGCGSVGTECAKRFAAFGCEILGVDIAPYESPLYSKMLSLDKLDEVISSADIVILTLPLNDETKQLFNKERLKKMKPGSVLVNIARGAIVSEDDLIMALGDKLFGAVLDVFCQEPLREDSPLWTLDNVILTPHNSFVSDGNGARLWNLIAENLKGCK